MVDVSGNYWSGGVFVGVLNCFVLNGELIEVIKLFIDKLIMLCFCGLDFD